MLVALCSSARVPVLRVEGVGDLRALFAGIGNHRVAPASPPRQVVRTSAPCVEILIARMSYSAESLASDARNQSSMSSVRSTSNPSNRVVPKTVRSLASTRNALSYKLTFLFVFPHVQHGHYGGLHDTILPFSRLDESDGPTPGSSGITLSFGKGPNSRNARRRSASVTAKREGRRTRRPAYSRWLRHARASVFRRAKPGLPSVVPTPDASRVSVDSGISLHSGRRVRRPSRFAATEVSRRPPVSPAKRTRNAPQLGAKHAPSTALVPEMDEDPTEILAVLLYAVVERLDLGLLQKAQHTLLQLAAPFARNNLDQLNPFVDGFLNDTVEFDLEQNRPC